jgi:hypothetical protein
MDSIYKLKKSFSQTSLNQDMAYSVYIDNRIKEESSDDPLKHTLPRRSRNWTEDSAVTSCYKCKSEFSMFVRRHHCRMCGKIFCYNCSSFKQDIPINLASDKSKLDKSWNQYLGLSNNGGKSTKDKYHEETSKNQRVCGSCKDVVNRVVSVKKITDVFLIMKFDIRTLKRLSGVCKAWQSAANYCLTMFREIQYKLPLDVYTDQEKDMLFINSRYMAGHSRYILALLKNCKSEKEIMNAINILEKSKTVSCRSLMCTRSCCSKILSTDAVNLLSYCFRYLKFTDVYKKVALKYLVCSDREFKCYLPFLVYNLRYDNGTLSNWLMRRCVNNVDLLSALYWEVNMYIDGNGKDKDELNPSNPYESVIISIKKSFSSSKYKYKYENLLQQRSFIKLVESIGESIFTDKKNYEDIKNEFCLTTSLNSPLCPSYRVKKLLIDDIKIKDSLSKPMILPCEAMNISTGKSKIIKIMYKKDDVRKDQIIMNIINLMSIVVKREEGINLHIVDYSILPTGPNKGMIEIIDDSDTVYYIQQKIKSSIINYIMEHNGDLKIKDLKDRFIKSTAAYSVLTYLLGVGDRHLDNIMIKKDGRLFHIDYGYILGEDPAFSNPSIRITPEIIEAMGGLSSESYVEFKDTCTKIFNCMRRNIDIFLNTMLMLKKLTNIKQSEEDIKQHLIRKFIPGENEVDAQLHLVSKLENSSYTDKIKDFCHYHSRERTFSGPANRLSSAVSGMWTPKERTPGCSSNPVDSSMSNSILNSSINSLKNLGSSLYSSK